MTSPVADDRVGEGPWYRRWFGETYLELYPHRDEIEAREAVELLVAASGVTRGDLVLDLACGAGRHLGPLRDHGLRPVGLDLSQLLLQRAKAAGPREQLVRADMRVLPFGARLFAAVTSFFTSFGYFRSEDDNQRVLVEVRRVLRDEGALLLDFLNADRVRETLSPRDEEVMNGRRVVQERRLVDDGRAVLKTITIEAEAGESPQVFEERVRLYSPPELDELLRSCQLTPKSWFGDYAGGTLDATAPRVIALARAS